METGNLPKCYGCKYLLIRDFGFSDYTVEGSMIECLQKKFEDREKVYDSDEKAYAEQNGYLAAAALNCKAFKAGDPLELNVDCDQVEAIVERLGE